MKRVFLFPEQGSSFNFKKDKDYNIFVNKNFWVNIKTKRNEVVIQKDGKGYIRPGPVGFDENAILGDGITLIMNGLSSLEDGGHPFGDPNFKDFLPN